VIVSRRASGTLAPADLWSAIVVDGLSSPMYLAIAETALTSKWCNAASSATNPHNKRYRRFALGEGAGKAGVQGVRGTDTAGRGSGHSNWHSPARREERRRAWMIWWKWRDSSPRPRHYELYARPLRLVNQGILRPGFSEGGLQALLGGLDPLRLRARVVSAPTPLPGRRLIGAMKERGVPPCRPPTKLVGTRLHSMWKRGQGVQAGFPPAPRCHNPLPKRVSSCSLKS
jgi:hypothetical protein